jgi:hypothetical protein
MPQPPSRLNPGLVIRKDEAPVLSPSVVVRKEDIPVSIKPPSAPPPPQRSALSYRPRQEIHDMLKAIALDRRTSIQNLLDEAVESWVKANSG